MTNDSTILKPSYGELWLILVVGALQPITELFLGTRAASFYNVVAAIVILSYVIYRIVKNPPILRQWGFRCDNFLTALPYHLTFALIGGAIIYVYGWSLGRTPLPPSFWYLFLLYPLWGLAQQFVLQNFLANNLTALFSNIFVRSFVTALLFSLSHAPSLELMLLAGIAGFFFTLLYHRAPNIYAIGIAHGILGALVFYLVLNQDQWTILLNHMGF